MFINDATGNRHTKYVYANEPKEAVKNYRKSKIIMVQEILEDDCRRAIRIDEKLWR